VTELRGRHPFRTRNETQSTALARKSLQSGDDLRPNRNHAQKQCQTSNRSGFLNDSANHVSSPLKRNRNIVTFGLFHVDLDQLWCSSSDILTDCDQASAAPSIDKG
jgi:hypothetical protein